MKLKSPIAVMVMGRPGAGKDTQADILANHFNLERVSTSDILKAKLNSDSSDPEIERERKIFNSGALNTASWVLSIMKEYIENLAKKDFNGKNGVVFSGSPRTLYESENLLPILEDVFGKDNIYAFHLDIPDEEGIRRIAERNKVNPRALDTGEEKLRIRLEEFYEKTKPAIDHIEDHGYLTIIDGMPSQSDISKNVIGTLENKLKLNFI